MPTVKPLFANGFPGVVPATAPVNPSTTPHVAPTVPVSAPAAAPPTGQLALPVPSFLTAPVQVSSAVDELGTGGVNYVGVLSERNGKFAMLKAAGIEEGQWFINTNNGAKPCHPMRFYLVMGEAFRTYMKPDGAISAATRDLQNKTGGLEEHVIALIVVDVGGKLIPAKADFRRTAATPGIVGLKAIRDASDPGSEWSTDPQNAIAKAFPLPWGRVAMLSDTQRRVSGTSGMPYYATPTIMQTVNATDMQRLGAAMQDDEWLTEMSNTHASYLSRVASIEKLCK